MLVAEAVVKAVVAEMVVVKEAGSHLVLSGVFVETIWTELDAVEVFQAACLTFLVGGGPGGEFLGYLTL